MFILGSIMTDCQPNYNESDSGDEEEEDLPGLLPSDLHTLPLPSSTTRQSECTEGEAMLLNQNNNQNWILNQSNSQSGKKTKPE